MNLSDHLRAAARAGQYGHACHPSHFYLSNRDMHQSDAGWVYWVRQDLCRPFENRDLTDDQVKRIATLSKRYRRLCVLAREVWPRWEYVKTLYFADNSTEVVERSARDGSIRQRMTVAPSGDACF